MWLVSCGLEDSINQLIDAQAAFEMTAGRKFEDA